LRSSIVCLINNGSQDRNSNKLHKDNSNHIDTRQLINNNSSLTMVTNGVIFVIFSFSKEMISPTKGEIPTLSTDIPTD